MDDGTADAELLREVSHVGTSVHRLQVLVQLALASGSVENAVPLVQALQLSQQSEGLATA